MAAWRPMKREPDVLRAVLYDYLRTRAPKVFLEQGDARRPLGRADMMMGNGRTLRVDLHLTLADRATLGTREAIVFDVSGHAADGAAGYAVAGRVVVDRATLAFLSIEAEPSVVNTR